MRLVLCTLVVASGCHLDEKFHPRDQGVVVGDMSMSEGDMLQPNGGDMAKDPQAPPDMVIVCGGSGQPCCGGIGGTCNAGNICSGSQCQSANVWAVGQETSSPFDCPSWHFDGTIWNAINNGLSANCQFTGMWGESSSSAWVVGGQGTNNADALIMTYDGKQFSACSGAQPCAPPAVGGFFGVTGLSSQDVWAFGHGLPIHWSGNGWKVSVGSIATTDVVSAMWCEKSTSCWAVGSTSTLGGIGWHWNGSTWEAPVAVGATRDYTSAVYGFGANDVWAGGGYFGTTTIRHFDGKNWSDNYPITASSKTDKIRKIWGAASNDVWAAGDKGTVLHWNGATWNQTTVVSNIEDVDSLYGRSANDIYIGGYQWIYHWNGQNWQSVQLVNPGTVTFYGFWMP